MVNYAFLLHQTGKVLKKKTFMMRCVSFSIIDLSRIPLQCVWTIASEQGWGGHFYTFAVFLSTLTSTQRYCLLECRKGLLGKTPKKILKFSSKLKFWGFGLRHPRSRISRLTTSETPPEEGRLFNLSLKRIKKSEILYSTCACKDIHCKLPKFQLYNLFIKTKLHCIGETIFSKS